MYSYPQPREYYTKDGGVEPYHPTYMDFDENKEFSSMVELSNEHNDFINWYKNHLLITNYLQNQKIPFIWNGSFLNTDYTDDLRFDGSYQIENGTQQNLNKINVVLEELYNFIKERTNAWRTSTNNHRKVQNQVFNNIIGRTKDDKRQISYTIHIILLWVRL